MMPNETKTNAAIIQMNMAANLGKPALKITNKIEAPESVGAYWKYHHRQGRAGKVGQASRLPGRAERRGARGRPTGRDARTRGDWRTAKGKKKARDGTNEAPPCNSVVALQSARMSVREEIEKTVLALPIEQRVSLAESIRSSLPPVEEEWSEEQELAEAVRRELEIQSECYRKCAR